MKFGKFKKEYRAAAQAATPEIPDIRERLGITDAPVKAKRGAGFKLAVSALSLLLIAALTLGALAVAPAFSGGRIRGTNGLSDKPSLIRASSYDDIDAKFSAALTSIKRAQAAERFSLKGIMNGIFGFGSKSLGVDDYLLYETPEGMLEKGNDDFSGMPKDNGTTDSTTEHSDTNTQTDGVDEADIIKTDGNYVYYADQQDSSITIFDVRNPSAIALAASISVDSIFSVTENDPSEVYINEMFLNGDRICVLFSIVKYSSEPDTYYYGKNTVSGFGLAVLDTADKTSPVVRRLYYQEGSYLSSRRIDDIVYIVTNKYSYNILEYTEPLDVVPRYFDTCSAETENPVSANDIYIGEAPETDLNFIVIGAVNIADDTHKAKLVSTLGSGDTVYASATSLFVLATDNSHIYRDFSSNTAIYKFSVNGESVEFKASGRAVGYTINQFSADEYNGYFRIATTTSERTNGITIFDSDLNKTGELTGLAAGETIYSVRFNGNKGYVVTYRTVDPLFAFDLSDPAAPKVTGELKIPGYSEYLHMYDNDTIIGIGKDAAAENEDYDIAYYQGLKVSLFDVSDDLNPSEKDTMIIGDRGTYSNITHDHKALAYYKSADLFGIPVILYEKDPSDTSITSYGNLTGYYFYIFKLNGGEKLELLNVISQSFEPGAYTFDSDVLYNADGSGSFMIERGVFIGNNIVTLSQDMIQINDIYSGDTLSYLNF